MANVMSTGVSGLLAFQRALDTTSQNIANVATPGYSRQRVELATRPAQAYGNGWVGSGVQVTTIARVYDSFLATQVRSSASSLSHYDTIATEAERLDNVLGDSKTGLATSYQNLINAFQDVANDPSSVTSRQVLLSQAKIFSDQLAGYDDRMRTFDSEINARLQTETSAVSTLAESLAKLNGQISEAYGRTGQPPNDLLDQRDLVIDEISKYVDVTVVGQENGSSNVFIGTGQPLVVGNVATKLSVTPDQYDPTRLTVAVSSQNGTKIDVASQMSGGSLGGLLEYRSQILDPARDALGKVAAGIVSIVNEQHSQGITLSGAMGGQFFSMGSPTVLAATNNSSTTASATITSATALTGNDYILEYTGSWQLRNATTGATVPMAGTGTALDPFTADGLSITVGSSPAVGDKFRIEPTRDLIDGLKLDITDPTAVAAASPVRTAASTGNTGSGTISPPRVLDASNGDLRDPVTIAFTSATTFTANGNSYTYTPGQNIDVNGWRVQINGAPAAGDQFTVADNSTGTGDNSNLLAMISALESPSLNGGTTSVADASTQLVAKIGTQTSQAQANRDAFEVVHDQDVSAQQSVSGVNLDEEAANLIMLQQAYQAAAQLISVAQQMFDSLLDATRR